MQAINASKGKSFAAATEEHGPSPAALFPWDDAQHSPTARLVQAVTHIAAARSAAAMVLKVNI